LILQSDNEILTNNKLHLNLIPSDDFEYLFALTQQYRYTFSNREFVEECFPKIFLFWKGFRNGKKIGVVYIMREYYSGHTFYTFDAFKDYRFKNSIATSLASGKLVIDYFKERMPHVRFIYSMHDERNAWADLALKKLGFFYTNEWFELRHNVTYNIFAKEL